jgi:hypothetical protein
VAQTSTKGLVATVKYSARFTLAQYEHEEISCELANGATTDKTPEELMREAIVTVLTNTTKYRNQKKQDKQPTGEPKA